MEDNALLDKGILIGYCFPIDQHHVVCKEYISDTERELYITDKIENIFDRRKREFIDRHRSEIQKHVRKLVKSGISRNLTSEDIKNIRRDYLSSGNDAYRYLNDYYDKIEDADESKSAKEIRKEIRDIARSYESLVNSRKSEFDDIVNRWERTRNHPRLDSDLSGLKEEDEEDDYAVTVDAHDLANQTTGTTVLVTNNPSDFAYDQFGQQIKEYTDIYDIKIVAVTSEQLT